MQRADCLGSPIIVFAVRKPRETKKPFAPQLLAEATRIAAQGRERAGNGFTSPPFAPFIAAAIVAPIALAARRIGSASRCAYRAVVEA